MKILIFDVKLRFALLASLCPAIFSENENDNKLVTLPARVKLFEAKLMFLEKIHVDNQNRLRNYSRRRKIQMLRAAAVDERQ
jgi:hypothetical protein